MLACDRLSEHGLQFHGQDVVARGIALPQAGDATSYEVIVASATRFEQRLSGVLRHRCQGTTFQQHVDLAGAQPA
jgi:hypothetical protein